MHTALILIGSNIDPVENTRRAVAMLRAASKVEDISSTWETQAVGSAGPNFLNTAVKIATDLEKEALKLDVLRVIEQKLGRVRTQDKNAPRTIDLDIIVFDGEVIDLALWTRAHVALPVSELDSSLCHPETGRSISEVVRGLSADSQASRYPSIF